MNVERRLIVGNLFEEQTAVVTIPIPAGGEVEIDPTWRLEGWLTKRKPWAPRTGPLKVGGLTLRIQEPRRVSIDGAEG